MSESVQVTVNGTTLSVARGTTIAAAVAQAGVGAFRRSSSGALRGPLCGMGICFECRAEVDGAWGVRTCQMPCVDGMVVRTDDA